MLAPCAPRNGLYFWLEDDDIKALDVEDEAARKLLRRAGRCRVWAEPLRVRVAGRLRWEAAEMPRYTVRACARRHREPYCHCNEYYSLNAVPAEDHGFSDVFVGFPEFYFSFLRISKYHVLRTYWPLQVRCVSMKRNV